MVEHVAYLSHDHEVLIQLRVVREQAVRIRQRLAPRVRGDLTHRHADTSRDETPNLQVLATACERDQTAPSTPSELTFVFRLMNVKPSSTESTTVSPSHEY